jgi:nitrite reductase/ring-hydroxylating ferredoxin subunit
VTPSTEADTVVSAPAFERVVVAKAADIPDGERMLVEVRGRRIVVFNVRGRFYALQDRCPHRGGPLCSGDVIGLVDSDAPGDWKLDDTQKFVSCPWHAWEFDLETGQSYTAGARFRSRPFTAEVTDGAQLERDVVAGSVVLADASMLVDVPHHRVKVPTVVAGGVFQSFPDLRMSFLEGGFCWYPSWGWRLDRDWFATRREIPWLDRRPMEVVREHIRFSTAPVDAGPPDELAKVIEWIGSEQLMFATDYPHHHDDRLEVLLGAVPGDDARQRLMAGAARDFYRL